MPAPATASVHLMSDHEPQSPFPPPAPPPMAPPPGYVSYGGPGAAMSGNLQPIAGLTKAAVALQIAAIALGAITVVLQFGLARRADDLLGNIITERDFEDSLGVFTLFSLLAGAVSIALLVVSIIWSFRISANLTALGRQITWKSGLTVVAWLLGGCTLHIITFLMLREHWQASDSDVAPGDQSWKSRPVLGLITAWFVAVISGTLVGLIGGGRLISQGFNMGDDLTEVADSMRDGYLTNALGGVIGIVGGVILVMIIRQLGARHMRLTREA
jgi:hypothetical protein